MKIEQMKIAKIISIIGHPLLTIPLFVAIMMFAFEDAEKAWLNSALIIGCIFLPLCLRMYFKSKNGTYTNFDVSDRIQRKTLFAFIIPIMIVVTIILFLIRPASNFSISVLFGTILVIISQITNLFIKSSLHVSLNIYLAALAMTANLRIGIAIFLLTGIIAWSRIALGRHTRKEVIFGCIIGLVIGTTMLYSEGFLNQLIN
ncbi:MAG TPA: phosphatase PAP2 family protein [Prolixibacteraceae bacterium]|nr:phosphatase PAP2 family protein [Prolixibacteraceae bacterium]